MHCQHSYLYTRLQLLHWSAADTAATRASWYSTSQGRQEVSMVTVSIEVTGSYNRVKSLPKNICNRTSCGQFCQMVNWSQYFCSSSGRQAQNTQHRAEISEWSLKGSCFLVLNTVCVYINAAQASAACQHLLASHCPLRHLSQCFCCIWSYAAAQTPGNLL